MFFNGYLYFLQIPIHLFFSKWRIMQILVNYEKKLSYQISLKGGIHVVFFEISC